MTDTEKLKLAIDEKIDTFFEELEEMMDASDDAWNAEQQGKYNYSKRIIEARMNPAKDKAKVAFKDAIELVIIQAIQSLKK
jgi:hypothetical protein